MGNHQVTVPVLKPTHTHSTCNESNPSPHCAFLSQHVPGLAGLTYGEARQLFPRALLCGLLSPASSGVAGPAAAPDTSLNPPEVTLIDPEDDLIFLATSRRDLLPDAAALGEARRQVEERERLGLPLKVRVVRGGAVGGDGAGAHGSRSGCPGSAAGLCQCVSFRWSLQAAVHLRRHAVELTTTGIHAHSTHM